MVRTQLISAFLVLCGLTSLAFGQSGKSDWDKAKRLKSGTGVIVITTRGQDFSGDVRFVTDDEISLVIEEPLQIVRVPRNEVESISKKRSRFERRFLGGLLGAGIGLGAGMAFGAIADAKAGPGNDDPGLGKALFGSLGLLFGAGIGAGPLGERVIPAKKATIYVMP